MPSLSVTGKWALGGGVGLTLGGLAGTLAPMVGAGSAVLCGLALAWVATSPMPRRMRRERLEFTWWIPSAAGAGRKPDEPIALRIALRNPTDETLVLGTPRLALSPGLRHARVRQQRLVIPPRTVASFELEVRASHAGRHVLHGAWMTISGPLGLAWAPLYFPNPLPVEVQPRASAARAIARTSTQSDPAVRVGRSTRRLGDGPELRELRDLQPGDPFRRIAWKASARRGRLIVRDTQDEAQSTRMLVIDASATMRGDDRGAAKIDYAIELAAQAARIVTASGDRLGLVGFASRVVQVVPPADGPNHARIVTGAALELRTLVDEDLTDVEDDALVRTVARYFREQEGLDPLRGVSAVEGRRKLAELAARAARHDPMMRMPVRARDPLMRVLRAFCRARAIPLPLRHDGTGEAKLRGLEEALLTAAHGARERRTILVVTDLDGVTEVTRLKTALGRLRQKRHRVVFVAPAGDEFLRALPTEKGAVVRAAEQAARSAVRAMFVEDEASRLRELRSPLAAMGASLFSARHRDTAALWIRRASAPSTALAVP